MYYLAVHWIPKHLEAFLEKISMFSLSVALHCLRKYLYGCIPLTSVADPRHFVADPGPAFHFDADPDPTFHSDADPDPAFQLDADQDPTTHFFPDLVPPVL